MLYLCECDTNTLVFPHLLFKITNDKSPCNNHTSTSVGMGQTLFSSSSLMKLLFSTNSHRFKNMDPALSLLCCWRCSAMLLALLMCFKKCSPIWYDSREKKNSESKDHQNKHRIDIWAYKTARCTTANFFSFHLRKWLLQISYCWLDSSKINMMFSGTSLVVQANTESPPNILDTVPTHCLKCTLKSVFKLIQLTARLWLPNILRIWYWWLNYLELDDVISRDHICIIKYAISERWNSDTGCLSRRFFYFNFF